MCDVLLPPGVNPTAVKYIYIISYIKVQSTYCLRCNVTFTQFCIWTEVSSKNIKFYYWSRVLLNTFGMMQFSCFVLCYMLNCFFAISSDLAEKTRCRNISSASTRTSHSKQPMLNYFVGLRSYLTANVTIEWLYGNQDGPYTKSIIFAPLFKARFPLLTPVTNLHHF
jgi:hypothetical protein